MRCLPLLFLLLGCESGVPRLHDVRSVTINYGSRDGQRHGFTDNYRQIEVSNAKDVQALVETFQVRSTHRLMLAAAFPGMVEFHLGDGSSVKCWFKEPDRVECQEYQVYLRDRAFYELVNKLISKKEGRPTDILKIRSPAPVQRK
jgi:hypothetical protein